MDNRAIWGMPAEVRWELQLQQTPMSGSMHLADIYDAERSRNGYVNVIDGASHEQVLGMLIYHDSFHGYCMQRQVRSAFQRAMLKRFGEQQVLTDRAARCTYVLPFHPASHQYFSVPNRQLAPNALVCLCGRPICPFNVVRWKDTKNGAPKPTLALVHLELFEFFANKLFFRSAGSPHDIRTVITFHRSLGVAYWRDGPAETRPDLHN